VLDPSELDDTGKFTADAVAMLPALRKMEVEFDHLEETSALKIIMRRRPS
jgi:hypothetical protein